MALAGRRRPTQPGGHLGDVGRSGDVVRLWCTPSPGELSGAESRHDPHRSVLTRAVGVGPTVDVDAVVHPVVPGVWLLLCTDGLTNEVGQDQIVSLMETSDEIGGAADALVELALANGGHENIAVAELCD